MVPASVLLSPSGPIDVSLFPGETSKAVSARLQQYLTNGYNDSRVVSVGDALLQDELAKAYALNQAFTAIYIRMSNQPLTLSVTEKGSHGFAPEQIRNMKALADKYLADFLGMLATTSGEVARQLPGSVSIRNTVEW
jgi:hypothetical protein